MAKLTDAQKQERHAALHKTVRDMIQSGKDLDADGVPELPALKKLVGFSVPKNAVRAVARQVRAAMGQQDARDALEDDRACAQFVPGPVRDVCQTCGQSQAAHGNAGAGSGGDKQSARKADKPAKAGKVPEVFPTMLYKRGEPPRVAQDAQQAERLGGHGFRMMDEYPPEEQRAIYESLPGR